MAHGWLVTLRRRSCDDGGGGGEGGGGDGGAGHDKKQGKAKEASAQSLRKGKTRVVYICVSLQHH